MKAAYATTVHQSETANPDRTKMNEDVRKV